MQTEPNEATQKKVIAGKSKKKKLAPKKKKKAGHELMDDIVARAQAMGAIQKTPAGLPGQKTIVKA